jgi:peptidoglycan-associated lipoprotein
MHQNAWKHTGLLLIVFSLLLTMSCAKKVVQSESMVENTSTVAEEPTVADDTDLVAQEQVEPNLNQMQPTEQAGKEVEVEKIDVSAALTFMNEDIYFDFDSATLSDAARDLLLQKAQWLRTNPNASVIIEGHCDERGTSAYNIALGDSRAESAQSYLFALGVEDTQLSTISYGEERPVDPGKGEQAWTKNRRAHFVIEF